MRYGNSDTPRFENLEERLLLSGGTPEDAAFGGDYGSTFKYIDADGTAVSVTLKSGSGIAEFSGDNLHLDVEGRYISVLGSNIILEGVTLAGTTNRSSLVFRTNRDGDGLATIGYIAGSGELGKLSGNTLDLIGQGILMTGAGCIGSVVLHDVRGGADIVMEGDGATRGVRIKAGRLLGGTDIVSDSYLKSLVANEWVSGSLITPWVSSINVKGNFGADISLSSQDSRGYSIRSLKAAGNLTGGVWDINGSIGSIRANASGSGWTLDAAGSVKSLYAINSLYGSVSALWFCKVQTRGDMGVSIVASGQDSRGVSVTALQAGTVEDASVTAEGGIKLIKAHEWNDTDGVLDQIEAAWIGKLMTTGRRANSRTGVEAAVGSFTGDILLSDGDAAPRGITLASASVAGDLEDSTWSVNGEIGKVTIKGANKNSVINHWPKLQSNISLTTSLDTPLTISYAQMLSASGASDADGDVLSFLIESVGSGTLTKGGVAVTAGETLLGSGESLVWTPESGVDGSMAVCSVRSWDGIVSSRRTVNVTVEVTGPNHAPTISTPGALNGTDENTPYSISYAALLAATGASDSDGDAVSFRIESVSSGTLTKNGSAVTVGQTLLGSGESLVWTPETDAVGTLDAFTVRSWDGSAASVAAVQVRVVVDEVNYAPTLSTPAAFNGTAENTPISISYSELLAATNASDADGDVLSFRVESVSSGTLTKNGTAVTPGQTLLGTGESLVWTPELDASGTLNAFTVNAWDGAAASGSAVQVRVVVSGVNNAPVLTSVDVLTGAEYNQEFAISHYDLLNAANASDPDGDMLSFLIVSVLSGALTENGTPVVAGSTVLGPGEQVVWAHSADAGETVPVMVVCAWDGMAASAEATVQAHIGAGAPVLDPIGHQIINPGDSLVFTVSATDPEGDDLTYSASNLPAGAQFDPETRVFSWTPTAGQTEPVTGIRFQVSDGVLTDSEEITISPNLVALGAGATNAYYIDNDADGYGVASPLGPDADDNDPLVNTAQSMLARYGSLENFLPQKGYNPVRIFYVSLDGNNDTGEVDNPDMPFRNWDGVQYELEVGDVVVYREGVHTDYISTSYCDLQGTAENPFVIMTYPGELVVIDHVYNAIGVNNASYVTFDGFVCDNTADVGNQGITLYTSSNITFRNIEARNHERGIKGMDDLHYIVIENSVFHDNRASHGIYLGARDLPNTNAIIRNNIMYRNGRHGFQHNGRMTGMVMENNIIHSNTLGGIKFVNGVSHSTVRNNLIFNNRKAGILIEADSDWENYSYIYPYDGDSNLITNNLIWMGQFNWDGTAQSQENEPSYHPAISINDWSGLNVSLDDNVIRNNILVSSYGAVIDFAEARFADTTTIENNVMYRAGGADNAVTYGETLYSLAAFETFSSMAQNNVFADPLLTDVSFDYYAMPELFNFDYLAGSPAIDFGVDTDAPSEDLRGDTRIGDPDAGCYEASVE